MPQPIEVEVPDKRPEEVLAEKVDGVRRSMLAFQRLDRMFNWCEELYESVRSDEEPSDMTPILEFTIRGPDGDPMTASFDTSKWSTKDQGRLATLLRRYAVADYGPALEQLATKSKEANDEYVRQLNASAG